MKATVFFQVSFEMSIVPSEAEEPGLEFSQEHECDADAPPPSGRTSVPSGSLGASRVAFFTCALFPARPRELSVFK